MFDIELNITKPAITLNTKKAMANLMLDKKTVLLETKKVTADLKIASKEIVLNISKPFIQISLDCICD